MLLWKVAEGNLLSFSVHTEMNETITLSTKQNQVIKLIETPTRQTKIVNYFTNLLKNGDICDIITLYVCSVPTLLSHILV